MSNKKIYVNLYDDYRQRPEYSINETTWLTITNNDDFLTHNQERELREILFRLLMAFPDKEVVFSRNPEPRIIDIVNLSSPKRHALFDYLISLEPIPFNGREVVFLMES